MQNKVMSFYYDYYGQGDTFPLLVRRIDDQVTTELHTHEFVELVLVFAGHGEHLLPDGPAQVKKGDVFVIPQGISHGYRIPDGGHLSVFNLLFSPGELSFPQWELVKYPGFQKLFMPQPNSPYIFFRVDESVTDSLVVLFDELLQECQVSLPASSTCRLAILMQLMVRLTRLYTDICIRDIPQNDAIRSVIEHLNAHRKTRYSIAVLAKMARMSRSNFLKSFKIVTGISPLQYMLMLQLNQACRDLITKSASVAEIAFDNGFEDSNYFTRVFRKHIGITPLQYRRRYSRIGRK